VAAQKRKRTDPPELTTVTAAAARFNVHSRTIRRWIERGELPAYRLAGSRQVRIRTDDLDKIARPITPERP